MTSGPLGQLPDLPEYNRPSTSEIAEYLQEKHPKKSNKEIAKLVKKWRKNAQTMTLQQTQIQEAIIEIPPSPPSEQVATPRVATPVTMTPPQCTITFDSPPLTQSNEQLVQFYVEKFQAKNKLREQQATDGSRVEEIEEGEVADKPKQHKGKERELTVKIPKEYRTPPSPASDLSALDLSLTVPPPNVYFNDGFTATKKAAYDNAKASSSKKPLTPPQTQQLPLPSASSCSIEEF